MKVLILDNEMELENELSSIEKLYDLIEDTIKDGEYHFSHLEIDGVAIYEDLESYMEDNIQGVGTVKVVTMTLKEFVYSIVDTSKNYFDRAIPSIENLADKFYSDPDASDWDKVKELFEGISWIFESFQAIDKLDNLDALISSYEKWNDYAEQVHKLAEFLPEMEESLKNEDNVLTGDLLSYEIAPMFESMKSAIEEV